MFFHSVQLTCSHAVWPPAGDTAIEPATHWLVRFDAGLFGLSLMAHGYDRSFLNRSRIYVEGSGHAITPSEGQVVTLIPGMPAENQTLPLTVSSRASTVSWFVNGELIGTAPSSQRLHWTPSPGKHEIVVADDAGRKARRTVDVQLGQQQH